MPKVRRNQNLNTPRPRASSSNISNPYQTLASSTATRPSNLSPTIPVHISRESHLQNAPPTPALRSWLPNLHIFLNVLGYFHAVFRLTLTVRIRFSQTAPVDGRFTRGVQLQRNAIPRHASM